MLIKFGSIVTAGRGKLGGHVYSKNRGGAYVRTNVVPSNPQSSHQQEGRSRLGGLSQDWSSLTAAQISAWNAAAPDFPRTNVFGDQKIMSGKNLFVGLNYQLLLVGEAKIDTPPAPATVEMVTALSIAQPVTTPGSETFEVTPTVSGTADHLIIEATAPLTAGTSYFKNKLRVLQVEDSYATGPVDIWDSYNARFGAPVSGKRIGIAAYCVNDSGQKTPHFIGSIVVS